MLVTERNIETAMARIERCPSLTVDLETTGLRPYQGDRLFGVAVTRKDYERAARIVQDAPDYDDARLYVIDAFTKFFAADNPRFDVERFRRACIPGANVRARG